MTRQTRTALRAIEEAHAPDAEKSERDALAEFHGEKQTDELTARAVLVDAPLDQKKGAEAKAAQQALCPSVKLT
jgi:hypothetical protein